MKKTLLLLFIGFCLTSKVWAQPEPLELPSRGDFLRELENFLNATKREDVDKAFDAFKLVINDAAKVPEVRYKQIYEISTEMRKQKMRAFPHYEAFMTCVGTILADEVVAGKHFANWGNISMGIMADLKQGRTQTYETWLDFSRKFFKSGVIYAGTDHQWKPSSTDFQIEYTEEQILKVSYPSTNMLGFRSDDTLVIENSSGVYYPLTGIWTGGKSLVKWDQPGLENVTCEFNAYQIEVKQTEYTAPEATLYHPNLFTGPVKGKFLDKIVTNSPALRSSYPRFESSEKRISLQNIGPGVEYRGGFKLYGEQIIGYGDELEPASIKLFNTTGELASTVHSIQFSIIINDRILSEEAEVSIYFGKDSIYHPGINFRYTIPINTLKLSQGNQGRSKTPFFNSFHMIEMFVSTLEWQIGSNRLEIGKGDANSISRKEVVFESLNLFDLRRYERYHNVSNYNPIAKIVTFWRELEAFKKLSVSPNPDDYNTLKKVEKILKTKVRDLDIIKYQLDQLGPFERKLMAEDIAYMIDPKFNITIIGRLLNDLVEDGFIFYDPETKVVTLRDKIFHYNDASINKRDFDRIRMLSNYIPPKTEQGFNIDTTSNPDKRVNAVLDMSDNTINVNWVRKLVLSDSQNVSIKPLPDGEVITVGKNRNFQVNGEMVAGSCNFVGKGFKFDYDRFEMLADSVDFMEIKITERAIDPYTMFKTPYEAVEADGMPTKRKEPLQSRLENLSGILLIDAPNNKSGREDIKIFPSFECLSNARVHYDAKFIRNGQYKREDFYYELDPFIFDTMDNFKPEYLKFTGKLKSADVFPDVREPIRIMWHDLSLGFEAKTPANGYPIYNGKGRFTDYFGISNSGLIGNGTVEYLGSKTKSDDIVFLPDQMLASSDGFKIDESRGTKPEYPKIKGDAVDLQWFPYKDSMYVKSKADQPFEVFSSGDYKLDGYLILSPGGLYGSGAFDWDEATMFSEQMLFGANSVSADTSRLKIRSLDQSDIAFDTENVKATIDFDTKLGRFISNVDEISTELPYNRFKTSLDDFTWDMDNQTIQLASVNKSQGYFLATGKGMDSLLFTGTRADYDLKTNVLRIDGTEFIPVADARIYPVDQKVEIGVGGEMKPFTNAKIIADTSNKYHVINRADVTIEGKFNYKASGYYEYNVDGKEQEILFTNITTKKLDKKKFVTIAGGNVAEEDDFNVDSKTKFKGTVRLSADSKNLSFDGYALLDTKVIPRSDWFTIKSPIDRKNVQVTYDIPRNPAGDKIYTGIYLYRDSLSLYPLIMAPKKKTIDRAIFNVVGIMDYDKEKDEFIFKDSTYYLNNGQRGNTIVVSDTDGKLFAEGLFQFGSGYDLITLQTAGQYTTVLENPEYSFNLVGGLKMPIPDILLDAIVADINQSEADATPIDYATLPYIPKALRQFITDDRKIDKIITKMEDDNRLEITPDMGYSFFFSKFNLKWSDVNMSFITRGALGLSTIRGKAIDIELKGAAEVQMSPRGDVLNLYFETPSGYRYYFTYGAGILRIFSTNEGFNTAFNGLKKKDKEFKLPGGESFVIEATSEGAMNSFINRARM